ncbi:MAG: helix-turn-helix transcriptional regulator [Pseudomonadota bacterium]
MKADKKRKLQAAGYRVSNTEDFLGMTEEEVALVEMKVLLTCFLKELRESQAVSQTELAKMIGSSQSRVAKMEAGDPSVSTDLLLRGVLALGASRKDIGKVLGSRKAA